MKSIILYTFLFVFIWSSMANAQVNQNKDRKIAVYLSGEGIDENYQANLSSVIQLMAVSGLPIEIVPDLSSCFEYGIILFPSIIDNFAIPNYQEQILKDYVLQGGCVIFSAINDDDLNELAGVDNVEVLMDRDYISFVNPTDFKELRWIDYSYESEIKLGATTYDEYFETYGYSVTNAEVLARFKSDEPAILKNSYGDGLVYTLGFSLRDLIIRNLMDRDFNATRVHADLFDSTSDVIMLLIRGMCLEAIPNSVWLSPAPYDSKSVLLITHDVCSHTAHIFSNDFAQNEYDRGIKALYNITTHQFMDDINGDNYTSHIPQMSLLVKKNMAIGSHSYGHFPDFDNADIFPKGSKIGLSDKYEAYFSNEEGRTIGGTVYGELGISKAIIERDLGVDVKFFRSGHLAVNPEQYNVLEELAYLYSSSYTARNVLTSFPYHMQYNRDMNGQILHVVEVPITCSDVFGPYAGLPMDEFNWLEKAESWIRVTELYADNNSPSTILIHPNRSYKLDAMEYLLDNMSDDIFPMELTEYVEFWKAKNTIAFSSEIEGSTLKIFVDDLFLGSEEFSFVMDVSPEIERVELYDGSGNLHSGMLKNYYKDTKVLFQKSVYDFKSYDLGLLNANELLYQNYPNPFVHYTTIKYKVPEASIVSLKIIDQLGRVVDVLVNQNQTEGLYEISYQSSKLTRGIYIYQLNLQTEGEFITASKRMLVK